MSQLRAAAADPERMTHAWLFTGPPGSGRSVAARAFAAALLCTRGGCGECPSCHQVAAGTQADLLLIRPDGLSYGVRQTRELVLKAATSPVYGRLAGRAVRRRRPGNRAGGQRPAQGHRGAAAQDDLAAVRAVSRRPHADDQVPVPAGHATHPADRRGRGDPRARGRRTRARRSRPPAHRSVTSAVLAGSRPTPRPRRRRADVLTVPVRVTGLAEAFAAAAALVKAAEEEAAATTEELDVPEREALKRAFGEGSTGKGVAAAVRGAAGALKELEDRQKSRATQDQAGRARPGAAGSGRVLPGRAGCSVRRVGGAGQRLARARPAQPRRVVGPGHDGPADRGHHGLPGAAGGQRRAAAGSRGTGAYPRRAPFGASLTFLVVMAGPPIALSGDGWTIHHIAGRVAARRG